LHSQKSGCFFQDGTSRSAEREEGSPPPPRKLLKKFDQNLKKASPVSLLSLTEKLQAQKVGRGIASSADLCYNGMGDENGRTEKSQNHSVEKGGL